jgi:pSer/pThr/pTyr-binding forkhead associated (FHA) protein
MSTVRPSTFIITPKGRVEEDKTVVGEGLRIGRLPDSGLWLNHPTVSRLHAGISEIEGCFYLINLSASSATALNGRSIPFNEAEALAAGDEIQIGPYILRVEEADEESETIRIGVERQFALNVGELEARHAAEADQKQPAAEGRSGCSPGAADALKIFWGKRTREKAGRPSPLHPQAPPHLGKARFNWTPTRDLVRPWPLAVFTWAVVVIGALSAAAAVGYKMSFERRPVSAPHARNDLALMPAIAREPSGGSCTSCHAVGFSVANKEKVNANCAACHQTEAFSATVPRAHREAGINCTDCHAEHRGGGFSPAVAGLEGCAKCHTDGNKNLYQGRGVHTPHGGTYGYPVVNGVWVWRGLDEEELAERPEIVALLEKNRATRGQTQRWRNLQFHGLHVDRVRAVAGVDGISDAGGADRVLSCGSCHKSGYMGVDVDRTFPRTTCARCHNARVFEKTSISAAAAQTPSCNSCHVQHIKDVNRASSLLGAGPTAPDLRD